MNPLLPSALLFAMSATGAQSQSTPRKVDLRCHRTANEDVPENTLESLEQAALLGCDLVEIDVRQTLDGVLVLNHDGSLERLTDGIGEVENIYSGDLLARDAGSWMGERFAGVHVTTLADALRFARKHNLRLYLDIKKNGSGAAILQLLREESMLDKVEFGGEWEDIRQLYPAAATGSTGRTWVSPGVTPEEISRQHQAGKSVVVNFSANPHQMDLASMKAAIAAGADSINVDFPRLGADAAGRPAEAILAALTSQADAGSGAARSAAILQLGRYRGFNLQPAFLRWLTDPEDRVSRAAAVALATARPKPPSAVFAAALKSSNSDARANTAWLLGKLQAPAADLLPLLANHDANVLAETLLALANTPGQVSEQTLLPFLSHTEPTVRGAAALALAHHQPEAAQRVLPSQLKQETAGILALYDTWIFEGKPALTPTETAAITGYFRAEMKVLQALSSLRGVVSLKALEDQAFRPGDDFAQSSASVAGFELWDRIGLDPAGAIAALASPDVVVADRAEWMLIQAGPSVLPAVRVALAGNDRTVQLRALHIVAWQRDRSSLNTLHDIQKHDSSMADEAVWAIGKIQSIPAIAPKD